MKTRQRGQTRFFNRLNLLLLLTGAAVVVGLVGLVAVTELVGYRDVRTWLFFAPVIPGVAGLACAAWIKKDRVGTEGGVSRFATALSTVMAWFTGCGTALALAALLLFVLFVAAICASGVQ